jgi:hypothetical protein
MIECPECKGEGTVDCYDCHGQGAQQYEVCDGFHAGCGICEGFVVICDTCDGDGEIEDGYELPEDCSVIDC